MSILKKFRTENGLTIKKVADAIGVEPSTYCAYEKGRRQPSFDKLVKIAKVFNCSVADFVEEQRGA